MRVDITTALLCALLRLAHAELPGTLAGLVDVRGLAVEGSSDLLSLTAPPGQSAYRWAAFPVPASIGPLGERATLAADVRNTGGRQVRVMLWVVGDRGWDAAPAEAVLDPGATGRLTCHLRETWPDGTPRIDPNQVKQIQVMTLGHLHEVAQLEVRNLHAAGIAPPWKRPASRLDVPTVEEGAPAPGRRVRFRLRGDETTGVYSVLHLPADWEPGASYPVIAEYPGNIFFIPGCYSTGRPEQCVIGYGITKGRGAICLSLPFVDRTAGSIAEDGWGHPDDTAAYAVEMVEEVCARFGGDLRNVVLTGFSRGALACGFIGLRNERIATLWKGFHACQHSDGDGWRGATLESAIERAKRFQGQAVFQTDNAEATFRPVMEAMKTRVTFAKSGLGAHATAMFLDDRPSTRQLREWFWQLVDAPPSPP